MPKPSILALIPARGGSKRLPKKNILPLAGKPLIHWTIEAAIASGCASKVMVSTDDLQIADCAQQAGAEVPFLRPAELASDTATTMEAVRHAIEWLSARGEHYDYVLLLQPTSPLRLAEHISQAVDKLEPNVCDGVISVTPAEHSPLWCNTLPPCGDMSSFLRPELTTTRSQDLPSYYRLNGAVYLASTKRVLAENSFYLASGLQSLVMDNEYSVDIDSQVDFLLAEALLTLRQQSGKELAA